MNYGAIMFENLFSRKPNSFSIDLETFAKAVRAGEVTVVDVREPNEFAAGHIPGAVSQPLSRFDAGKLPNGKPVVLFCQAGGRSRKALDQAHAAGRTDVRHYPPAACPSGARTAAPSPDPRSIRPKPPLRSTVTVSGSSTDQLTGAAGRPSRPAMVMNRGSGDAATAAGP